MPQVPIINNSVLPFAEPTWSIGIEEIFYLIIPWIIVISKKKFATGLIVFMLLFSAAKYLAIYFYQLQASDFFAKLITYYRYDCIALGCLMGVLHHNKNKIFQSIKNLHVLFSLLAIFILFKYITIKSYDYFPFAICFAVIIAYLVNNKEKFKSPRWLIHIGTVSYSLYLTHEIVVVYFLNLNIDSKSMIAMYLLSILCSIFLASIVYYCVERPFMKFGNYKVSKIKTL
jgi:peptidoglycan/LPS O-acetylase OafA/YrhL